MTDRDWYNYLKANFKPTQGTAYFFDLANCRKVEDLKPTLVHDLETLEGYFHQAHRKSGKCAYIEAFHEETSYFFTKEEFTQEENLTTCETEYFQIKEELDMEKVKKELAQLFSFILNSQAS